MTTGLGAANSSVNRSLLNSSSAREDSGSVFCGEGGTGGCREGGVSSPTGLFRITPVLTDLFDSLVEGRFPSCSVFKSGVGVADFSLVVGRVSVLSTSDRLSE